MTAEQRRVREALLDDMLADSFPASDAPSFTPVIGVGGGDTPAGRPAQASATASARPAPGDAAPPVGPPDAHLAAGPA